MMMDPQKSTNNLMKWAEEIANKVNCSSTRVLALFCIENKKPGRTEEQSKVIVANNLINNGGSINEN